MLRYGGSCHVARGRWGGWRRLCRAEFIGNLGAGEIIVIALIVLLLFGGKKIPELMKGLGKGVRSFKEGMNNIENDIENSGTEKSNNENK